MSACLSQGKDTKVNERMNLGMTVEKDRRVHTLGFV